MFEGLFQPMHLIIILIIALVIFGPGKLPELGKGLGKSIREFKKAMQDMDKEPDLAAKPKETTKEITSPGAMEVKQESASKDPVEVKKTNPA